MSNSKTPNFDIQEYSFGQLVPTEDSPHLEGIQDYELKSLDEIADFKQSISADVIRTEREMESKNGFQIAPEVREQRGLKQQEEINLCHILNIEFIGFVFYKNSIRNIMESVPN